MLGDGDGTAAALQSGENLACIVWVQWIS